MPHQNRGGGGGGTASLEWVEKYNVDWPTEFADNGAHDFLAAGPAGNYTDDEGATWGADAGTIIGTNWAAAMDLTATGIVTTTLATGNIILFQYLATMVAGYTLDMRTAVIAEFTSADQNGNYNNVWLQVGSCGADWDHGAHRMWRGYNGGAVSRQKRKQQSPANYDSNNVTLDNAFHDVYGVDSTGDAMHNGYYGAAVPAAPFTGLTASDAPMSILRNPDDITNPYTAANTAVTLLGNAQGGGNFTFTFVSLTVWAEEAVVS